ncbi:thioredoxin family protein [Rubripirellula tenax]|uniref:thioredoxin family protein n=1 Tax=Rubripirellula tenax TaxID=2528015 RepID=UPI0016489470|nr:thioredoxin family protein [Rubripirellula tenax]
MLVKLGSTSCGPCNRLDTELAPLQSSGVKDLEIRCLSVSANKDMAEKHQVNGIPRMILFRNGEKLSDVVGFQSQDQILR